MCMPVPQSEQVKRSKSDGGRFSGFAEQLYTFYLFSCSTCFSGLLYARQSFQHLLYTSTF